MNRRRGQLWLTAALSLGFPRRRLDLLQELAARVLDVRKTGDNDVLAKDLLVGFVDVCARAGLDGILHERGADPTDPFALAEDPALRAELVAQLGKNFVEGGPRNAMPRLLAECVLATLGLTLVDEADRSISLGDDARAEMMKAMASVIDVELAPATLRARIIDHGRARCEAVYHGAYDKITAQLDERGMTILKQPKLPLDAVQAVQKVLTATRDAVIGRAAGAAIDRAKAALERTSPEAAARIDAPLTHQLTPRDVAIRRVTDPRAPKASAAVVQGLFESLVTSADLVWRAPERAVRTYSARETFAVGDLIEHPKFGRGTVTTTAIQRIEVEFADGTRALVHGK